MYRASIATRRRTSMNRRRTLVGVVVSALGLWIFAAADSRTALADTFTGLVQIACSPELNYFSIRRFGLPNLPQYVIDRLHGSPPPAAINSQGLFIRWALEKAPAECDLVVGAKTARIRTVGIYKDLNQNTSSSRFIVDQVEISANGKLLGQLFLSSRGFQAGIDFMEVFVNGSMFVRKCAYYDHVDNPALKTGCTLEELQ
jgi:hypothetical protein